MTGSDVVVIGAGAAGVAASRALHHAGLDVLLVEAADRLGGRAHTVSLAGQPFDLGCGWLHSARRNPWTDIAEAAGFEVDRAPTNWRRQYRDLGYPPAEQHAFGQAMERWHAAAEAARDGPDRPLADFVPQDDPARPHLEAISSYVSGAQLAEVSLHDWLAYEDSATDDNWTVPDGYGAVIAGHGAGVPTRLGTPVTRIDHRGPRLRIETTAGTIETARAIVTVSTAALAGLAFDPPLPDKHDAAAALPLGLADKVFLAAVGAEWPDSAHLIGNPHAACTASYRLAPFGRPVVECFLGGDCAEALERAGADAAAAFCIDELVALLGGDWRRRLTPLAATRWRATPHVGGSYSHAHVGQAGARQRLAEPVDGRVFFAGEACSRHDFSTAHGAYATGIAAAEAILATLPVPAGAEPR